VFRVALYIALYKGLYITGTIVSMTAIIADTWPRNYYKIEIVLKQYHKQKSFMYLPSSAWGTTFERIDLITMYEVPLITSTNAPVNKI